jgi:1-phosphofructokinase/tagatose 6-phosphate kinase
LIITVTLNAAIDRTLTVPSFRPGRRHRSVEQRTMAGGKGVNVARTLKTLGQPVIATGFAGGSTGTRIVEMLTEESIICDFMRIREESRTNLSVVDPTTGEQTEVNERGPAVSGKEMELFRDKLLYLARGADIVVFAGSLPRGVEPDTYANLIREVRKMDGITTVVDCDGEALRQAVRAEPSVVSPNVLEAEELVGHEFNDAEDYAYAVREISQLGPREAIMTVEDGCYASVLEEGAVRLHRVRVEPREPLAAVGSGDAFLAGYVAARYTGSPAAECLRFGVACGTDSTQELGAGVIDAQRVERLLSEVVVEPLELPAEVS